MRKHMDTDTGLRSMREVFEDHFRHRRQKEVGSGLHNVAPDVAVLTGQGTYHGHDGIRASLASALAGCETHAPDHVGWPRDGVSRVDCREPRLPTEDGVGSFLIRDGLIRVQTIHHRVVHSGDAQRDRVGIWQSLAVRSVDGEALVCGMR